MKHIGEMLGQLLLASFPQEILSEKKEQSFQLIL